LNTTIIVLVITMIFSVLATAVTFIRMMKYNLLIGELWEFNPLAFNQFAGNTSPLHGIRGFAVHERRRSLSSGLANSIISRLPGSFGSAILRYIMFIGRNLVPRGV